MNYKDTFETHGFLPATDILNEAESIKLQRDLATSIDKYDILNNEYRCKSHMLFKWVDELSRHPKIVSIVKEILGENIICLDTMFWGKNPKTAEFVSFHQDGYYWPINEPVRGVVVWVPFQDTNDENGTIQYVDKSHSKFLLHENIIHEDNKLRRGQTVDISALDLPLISCSAKLGQVTMHHPYNIHGSFPNKGDKIRLACNLQYIAADVDLMSNEYQEYGTLISGKNTSKVECIREVANSFELNQPAWEVAWHNQRQNYLKSSGRY
jgi:ectoine hydroxylase-related dioxygenase (phytanoyl-CoA dioxygenase family)